MLWAWATSTSYRYLIIFNFLSFSGWQRCGGPAQVAVCAWSCPRHHLPADGPVHALLLRVHVEQPEKGGWCGSFGFLWLIVWSKGSENPDLLLLTDHTLIIDYFTERAGFVYVAFSFFSFLIHWGDGFHWFVVCTILFHYRTGKLVSIFHFPHLLQVSSEKEESVHFTLLPQADESAIDMGVENRVQVGDCLNFNFKPWMTNEKCIDLMIVKWKTGN